MTKEKTKEEKLVIEGQLKDKIIQDLCDDVTEDAENADAYEMAKAEIDALKRENVELKLLLKESIETFPTKRLADRIYKMPGIERPTPQPIPVKDEDIPY